MEKHLRGTYLIPYLTEVKSLPFFGNEKKIEVLGVKFRRSFERECGTSPTNLEVKTLPNHDKVSEQIQRNIPYPLRVIQVQEVLVKLL